MELKEVKPGRDAKGRYQKGYRSSHATEFKKGQHWRPFQAFRDHQWLMIEYIDKGRSTGDIAKQFGVKDSAILFWLRKHGITRRTVSQARSLKKWGAEGEMNPMFGRRGPLSPRWAGGISPSRQALYSSLEWKRVAKKVRNRDEKKCRRCGSADRCELHHIIPLRRAPLLALLEWNIILLCFGCHRRMAGKEGRWMRKLLALICAKGGEST